MRLGARDAQFVREMDSKTRCGLHELELKSEYIARVKKDNVAGQWYSLDSGGQ